MGLRSRVGATGLASLSASLSFLKEDLRGPSLLGLRLLLAGSEAAARKLLTLTAGESFEALRGPSFGEGVSWDCMV